MPDNEILQRANEAFSKGKFRKASKLFEQIPEADLDADLNLRIAICQKNSSRFWIAERYTRNALELDPENWQAHLVLAELIARQWRGDEAEKELAIVTELLEKLDSNPDNIWNTYATVKYFQEDYESATTYLRKSLAVEPGGWYPHYLMGQIYNSYKDKEYYRGALDEYVKAFKKHRSFELVKLILEQYFIRLHPVLGFAIGFILLAILNAIIKWPWLPWIVIAFIAYDAIKKIDKKNYKGAFYDLIMGVIIYAFLYAGCFPTLFLLLLLGGGL